MLAQSPTTIPASLRDYPEWHRGRGDYAVWLIKLEADEIREKVKAAQRHLADFLLQPYQRQPHITLFVCGFLTEHPQYEDDFSTEQFRAQAQLLKDAQLPAFPIEVGGLNSFASAPFLTVTDPQGGIDKVRAVFARTVEEIARSEFTPHVTIGLYAGAYPSEVVLQRMAAFPVNPLRIEVKEITFATYQAREVGGMLKERESIGLLHIRKVPGGN
jgi:2'-5' RNA ligase